jgi:hypothetical protein
MAEPIEVNRKDGKCKECSGTLQVIEVDDATMEVECKECGTTYKVETDAFNDGGIDYWPRMMAAQMEDGDFEY